MFDEERCWKIKIIDMVLCVEKSMVKKCHSLLIGIALLLMIFLFRIKGFCCVSLITDCYQNFQKQLLTLTFPGIQTHRPPQLKAWPQPSRFQLKTLKLFRIVWINVCSFLPWIRFVLFRVYTRIAIKNGWKPCSNSYISVTITYNSFMEVSVNNILTQPFFQFHKSWVFCMAVEFSKFKEGQNAYKFG